MQNNSSDNAYKILFTVLSVFGAVALGLTAYQMAVPPETSIGVFDFEIFHLAGRMIWAEGAATPYDADRFLEALKTLPGYTSGIFLWSYPPQFAVVSALLALLPVWLAYVIFEGGTLLAFLWVLRRLAGTEYNKYVVLALLPIFALTLRTGQNGFLTGFLIGLACLIALKRSALAGLPLGLMAIKPHLALGVGISFLLRRSLWLAAALSLGVVALSIGITILIFGFEAWSAFLESTQDSSGTLLAGGHQLFRQVSVFASAFSLGLSANVSLVIHILVLLVALLCLAFLAHRKVEMRDYLGFAILVSAMVSPYSYDYDMPMLGIAGALLVQTLVQAARPLEGLFLFFGSWVVLGSGLAITIMRDASIDEAGQVLSVNGLMLSAMGAVIFYRLIKPTKPDANSKVEQAAL